MNRSWKTTVFGSLALALAGAVVLSGVAGGSGTAGATGMVRDPGVAGVTGMSGTIGIGGGRVITGTIGIGGVSGPSRSTSGGEGSTAVSAASSTAASAAVSAAGSAAGGLWAAATIEPGREGIVEVGGYEGGPLGAGSALTLTAPASAKVTGTPFVARGYRGSVSRGGRSGTYTFVGTPASSASATASAEAPVLVAWTGRTFPFVLSIAANAEPGTRLPDCALVLRDEDGTVRERGTCTVTVGMPAPTLSRPQSGVPLSARPQTSGTAYPGAQVTVRDAAENEVCATTAAPDGTWSCTPGLALRPGPGRLQATATFNGVSATSEQINITVAGSAEAQPNTVSDSEGGRLRRR